MGVPLIGAASPSPSTLGSSQLWHAGMAKLMRLRSAGIDASRCDELVELAVVSVADSVAAPVARGLWSSASAGS